MVKKLFLVFLLCCVNDYCIQVLLFYQILMDLLKSIQLNWDHLESCSKQEEPSLVAKFALAILVE